MKKKYLYNGEYYTESEMTDFAKQSGVSFDNYIAALGKDVKVLDAPFEFKGNFYTQDEISAAAKKKGISDDTYLSQYGIKKKEDANIGGGISSAASKIGGQVGNFVGQSEKDNALSLIQSINAGITKGIEKGKQQFPNEIRATPEEEAALRDAQRRTGQADGLFTQQGAEQFNLLATDPLRAILDPEREKLQTAYNNRRLQGVRQTSDNTIARNNIDPNKTVQKKDGKLIPNVSYNPEYQVKNQEQALENVASLVKNKFFKNGKEALEYAENQVKSGIDPTGNETFEFATERAGEYKQKEEAALNGKSIIQNAIEIQLQNDPLFKKQYETIINGTASDAEIADVARRFNIPLDKLKTQGSLPQEVVGELVHRFISDPDIKQIAEDNPEFKKDFDNFTGDKIYEVFPEYADVYIKNTLSRARELDGKNNWFANPIFDKSKYMDNLAEEVFKDRPILLKRVKDKFHNNWEHKIETTGIVDDLATGARGAMSGMWRSLKDVSGFGESYSDRIRNTLKEQYGHVETPHQNEFRKVVGEASNFMGMVLAMGATGSGLGNIGKGLGVMNPSVASKAVTLATFFDDELNHAASIYPENPTKAYLRASLSTAFFLVAGDAIPASKITGFKQNITQTLKSLETKALDKQAKMKLRDKILSVATETLQGTAKGTAEMTVMINGFKLLIDRALGLDESSINNEYSDANLLATAKSMLFGLPVPSMIHGFKGINRTRAAIYEMASNPEKYKSAILKRFGSDDHRIADIDFIADFKKYLDSMRVAENEKAKMVFNALHAKRLREQKSPDAFMKRNHEEEIRAIEQEQQDIMDGKDSDAGLTDSQKAIKTAYENGEINEMMEAQIKEALKDPAKADQFIKEIAEQATGAVAPELGNAKDGAIKFFGETLTDFAIGKSGKKGGGESVVFEYENEGEVPQKLKPLMVKDENGRITITMPKDEADALQKRIAEGLEPDMELMDGTLIKKADIKIKDSSLSEAEKEKKKIESTAKQKSDPDLANIDPVIIAARNGDKQAQKKLEEYGLDWEQTTTYRFVGQPEVDVLLSDKKVESKRFSDAGIDVTTSPKVTSAANAEYRVTFKESFDVNNGLGKVKVKSKEEGDHNLEKGRGYTLNDVAKIERLDENGNVVEVIYDSESLLSKEQQPSVNKGSQQRGNPALSSVESTAKNDELEQEFTKTVTPFYKTSAEKVVSQLDKIFGGIGNEIKKKFIEHGGYGKFLFSKDAKLESLKGKIKDTVSKNMSLDDLAKISDKDTNLNNEYFDGLKNQYDNLQKAKNGLEAVKKELEKESLNKERGLPPQKDFYPIYDIIENMYRTYGMEQPKFLAEMSLNELLDEYSKLDRYIKTKEADLKDKYTSAVTTRLITDDFKPNVNEQILKAVESLLSKEQQPSVNKGSQQRGNPALSSVESTAKALEGIDTKGKVPLSLEYAETDKKAIAEAYHADRAAGKETELTKAVEELLGKPTEKPKTETTPTVSSEVVSGSALKDVVRQESDAEKLNKEAGVDIYVARQDIDTNGGKYTLSQIKENGNTNTFLIEDAKGNEVGKAQLSANGNYLENIRIDEKHRRKGLASKVYDFIELRKGIELEPSPNKQSKEAKALWDKRNLQKSVSNKANGGLLAKALGESMSKTFADFRNKQQVLLELENKYFEQKGLSKEEFNKLSENEKSEIIKDAIKWKNDNPELVKAVEELLGKKEEVKSEQKAEKPTEQKPTIEQQVKTFGVADKLVKPVTEVANALFSGLKKVGLTAAKNVGEWVGIGKGTEKPYSLKIDGKDTQVKNVQPEVVNGFYSPLEKIITESKFDKLPAKQWAEKYANSEEAKWTGLKDWLNQQQGSVSKADIQQYLKDNRIQVVEVVKGEDMPNYKLEIEPPTELGADRMDLLGDLGKAGNLDNPRFRDYLNKKYGKNGNKIYDWLVENATVEGTYSKDTKFSQYQLEGQKYNYKEILVTMPAKKTEVEKKINDFFTRMSKKYGENFVSKLTPEENRERVSLSMGLDVQPKNIPFKSSHFDEPNILVHLRMNTRKDSQGNKVLFLEEIQSDWGQKGKKEGFIKSKQDIEKEYNEADKKLDDLNNKFDAKYGEDFSPDMLTPEEYSEYSAAATSRARLGSQLESGRFEGVPTAPFVTDTNAWTKLGLKVALKEAVKQGADKIAWSTGTQQFDRWGSEKISWKKEVSEKYPDRVRWKIDLKEQESGNAFDGINIDEKALSESNVSVSTKEQLREVLNRNLKRERNDAEIDKLTGRIWDRMQKEDSGTSLPRKEGMESFYGKPDEGKLGIVGNVAKSLFKQEPSLIKIVDKDTPSIFNRYNEKKNELSEKESRVDELYNEINNSDIELPKQAREYNLLVDEVQDLRKEIKDIERTSPNALKQATSTSTQHSIDITPEMKKQVETEGQPLFKDAEAQYRIESGKNIVEALKDFDGSPKAVTAIVHEFMHPTVVEIFNGAKEGNETGARHANTIVEEYNKANPDKKITLEQMIEGNDAFINGRTTPEYRAVQEFIAEAWEKYHHEGAKGFSKAFQEVLDAITEVFRQVYKSLTGTTLTPELRKMFDELLGKENVSEVVKAPEISSKAKNKFSNLREKIKQKQSLKIVSDEAENRHANSKLTEADNPVQEPNVKALESEGENAKNAAQAENVIIKIDSIISAATDVGLRKVSDISTDEKRFQGRDKLNAEKVQEIAENWKDADQDPIHVWTDPKDGKTYVLSGHHRLAAAKQAGREKVKVIDRSKDFTEEQAIRFAKEEANANRTMETAIERANTLRQKRERGDTKDDINKFLDREGKNKNFVNNLSRLNPKGKTIEALRATEKSDDKVTQKEVEKIADWIGEARDRNKNLTDAHENELFDFLMDREGSKRITTKQDFLSKVNSLAGAMDFNANEPLNIARYKHKTEGEKLYDKEAETQKGKISDLQQRINEINDRIKNPNNPQYLNPDSKDYEEIKKNADNKLSELNTELQAESKALLDLYQQKGKFARQGTEQSSLFSTEKNETELPEDYYNDLRDIIKDLKDEHKGITLDEIKEIAKNELGEYYSEPDIEAAYKMTEPQPPKSAPEPPKSAPSRPDKSVLTNIVNAENTPPEVKKKLTAHGLKYDPESHDEALQIARAVIDSLGIDAAVTEARARNFGGAVNTFIQTEALNALYKKEAQAKTAQEKYEAAEKFAEVSIALDEWARGDAGRGISALATFYQKSPLGMVLKENKSRKEEFNQWAKGKEESWDEFLERLNKTPEFSDYVSEKVQTELREERKKERSKFFKKVDDTLDKWINDLESGNVAFSSVVPPKLIAEALKGVKAAFKVGESATKIIGDAIDYISDKIGDNWDKDTFRAKIEKALNLRAEKTSVDRYADSLKKQIEELQKQIDAGSRNKNQSNKRQLTPEEQSLLDEKKRLQKELNDIDPKTTFAQRIQKQIDDIQRQIDAGKRDEKERKNKKEYSEEEKELQEKLKAKKAELEALSPLKNTESYKLAELDKFREKLKGLSEAEKDEVVSKAYKKLLDNGALDHADLREIIAKATGRGNLTEKQAARLQELNETINAAEIAKQKHLKERTEQTLKEYHKAIDMAAKAKRDLANEFDKKTDYLKVISSSIQGNTLGLLNVAVMNPLYNITTHLALRLPIGTVQSLFGLALGKAEMNTVFGKPMQAEFFGKGGRGFREAFKGLLTGMNKADYESKEIFSSQIRPNRSLRALLGKDNREAKMKLQEKLFHTFSVFPGATAETNFRLLNFGDKPMRYSASAATAAAFAKKYGIKFNTMDWKTFMEFPREIVKEMELAKGKSLKEAEQEAEYVVRSIEKEGERSTMQQDNFFSDMLEKVFSGGKHEGAKSLAKTLTISPFVKIPSNVLWLGYNLVHPQIALAQAAAHTIRSYGYRGKGEIAESKLQMREARYWMSVTMMGAALQAVMIPLIKAGIITAANDEDDSKKKRIADLTYQPQGMFNMTKFWAYLSGKNVNEVQGGFEIPLKYFGLPGALGNSLARDYKQLTPEQKENRRLLTDNLLELFDADDFKDIENGIFSSSSSLLQGLKGGDMTYYAGNMVNLFTNLIQPAAVSEFSRAAIPYRISGKFDSLGDKIKNDLSNRSALFRKLTGKYPKGKRNIWGEIIKKDDSYANRYFGFNNVTKDNFAQFIYEDAQKWDDEDFLPPTVSNSLGGKKLTAEQLDELEENIGLARKEFIRAYTNDIALIEELGKNYSDILGRDAKKAALQYLYQKGRKLGVDMFVSKHPEFENVVSEEEKQVEELLKNFKEINLISEDEINEKIKH